MIFLLAKGGERISSAVIFGGRGRDATLASATVKGTINSSTREAIRVDLDTRIDRNVAGSLVRKSSSMNANVTAVKKKKTWNFDTNNQLNSVLVYDSRLSY